MMNSIIKNTPVSVDQVKKWRKQGTDEEVPLMVAKHNAQVSILIDELNSIRDIRAIGIDDMNYKIDRLVEIILRGVEFRD